LENKSSIKINIKGLNAYKGGLGRCATKLSDFETESRKIEMKNRTK